MTPFVTTVLLAVGAVGGIVAYWLFQRTLVASLRAEKERLSGQLEATARQLSNESASRAAFEERASRLPLLEAELEALNVRLTMVREEGQKLREENARLATTLAGEKQQSEANKQLLAEQFQN